jgi:glycosyltransferase involved in cell wall biosynthesis
MKILYVITKSNWGGAQKHVYDLATSMKAAGHTVVVSLGGNGVLRNRLEDIGIKTYSVSKLGRDINVGGDAGSFAEIFSIIKREKPDVLHLHSTKAAGLGALAGKFLRIKKIIYTVHGWPFNEDRSLLQKIFISIISWFTGILCHKIVLLSQREYNQTLHFPYLKEKLIFIPQGMRAPVFMSIDGSRQMFSRLISMDIATMNRRILIGTNAELHSNKGLIYLLQAMEQVVNDHPNTLLIIVGDGEQKEYLQTLINEKNLSQYVKLVGYVDHAAEYLKAFNLFVLPSLKEGMPYALIEAGYASLPVISTTVGGIPEIVEDMKSGVLVQPKNFRELSHAISYMIEHPGMRKQYAAALKEAVTTKFSLEKMIERISSLYKE